MPGAVGVRASCRSGRRSAACSSCRGDVGGIDLGGPLAQHRVADRDDLADASRLRRRCSTGPGTAGGPSARRRRARRRGPGTAATSPTGAGRAPCRRRGSAPTAHAGAGAADAAGGVQREHVEEHGVARLELQPRTRKRSGSAVDRRAARRACRRGTTWPGRRGTTAACTTGPRCEPATNSSVDSTAHRVDGEPHARRSAGRRRCSTAGPGATACAGGCPAP